MKKAGIRFSNNLNVIFEYNESTKNVYIKVVEGNDELTGNMTVKKTTTASTNTRTAGAK